MEKIKRILNIILAIGVLCIVIGLFRLIPRSISNENINYYVNRLVSIVAMCSFGSLLVIGSAVAKYCFAVIYNKTEDLKIEFRKDNK